MAKDTAGCRALNRNYIVGESISMINALSVQEVSKVCGSQTVLNNISFDCAPGQIYGLIGRNGSGKTMLLKCICGLVKPTTGAIFVWGRQVGRDIEFPETIGFIIEHPGFLLHESGLENLKHLASIRKRINVEQIQACMKLVGLDPNLKKPVSKYSLGMRQRLGIAQAIMENPNFLILDEPMNGLDNQGVKHIRSVLKELSSNGTTILLASHSMEDIDFLCDEVYQMDAGVLQKRIH